MHKCLQYLKVDGAFVNKGDVVDLSNLSAQEIARLKKKGIVEPVGEKVTVKQTEENEGLKNEQNKQNEDGEMTDEEARAELLEKITHAVAVKELTLLGAEFKKNASLETLIDIIMAEEEYEEHFFDYIDANGL